MNLKKMLLAATAAVSSCMVIAGGFAPAANAATATPKTPSPIVLTDVLTGIVQVSSLGRPANTAHYLVQRYVDSGSAKGSWKTITTASCAPKLCTFLMPSRPTTYRMFALGTNGYASAASVPFAVVPAAKDPNNGTTGDVIDLTVTRASALALAATAVKFNAERAPQCLKDKAWANAINQADKKLRKLVSDTKYKLLPADAVAAMAFTVNLLQKQYKTSCAQIAKFDALVVSQTAKAVANNQPQNLRVSSIFMGGSGLNAPQCNTFFGSLDSGKFSQVTTKAFVWDRADCREFARKLWVAA